MRISLLFPPQWTPLSPYYAFTSLAGQLRNNGYEVNIRDLNVEFYDKILKKDHLKKTISRALSEQDELFQYLASLFSPEKTEHDYSQEFQKKLCRYNAVKDYSTNKAAQLEQIPEIIEDAVAIMRCPERFYQPDQLIQAMSVIDQGLELASFPYLPSKMNFSDYYSPFLKFGFESIKEQVLDRATNMFYEYYEEEIPGILSTNPDMISISINSSSQIVPGLTLAMLLKQKTTAYINIGGNFFGRVAEALQERPEFFHMFVDSINIGEGEGPIVEIAKHVEGKIDVTEVPNLLYIQDGKVLRNEDKPPIPLNKMYNQDLTGFPIDLYFAPDLVLATQSSRGCYWKMCSFCDHDFGLNLNTKNIDKLVSDIKELNQKFGIKYFEFIDESIHPKYLEEMSQKILDEGLDIYWFNNARLENEFTKERLELAHKAGLRMLLWGFESGSDRIMKLINKGIEIGKRCDILRDSRESGIWNFAFIFFGFPTETWEDGLKTIETICSNTDIICSYGRSVFTLGKHTRLRDNPEKYCITEIMENEEEFSPSYNFKTSEGMDHKAIVEMSNLCTQKCNEAYGNPLWMYLRYREILFLYVAKFGTTEVQNCKISN